MTFTLSQITELRSRFAKINSVDPDGAAYAGMCKLLDALDQEDLSMLAVSNIKFLSKLAANRVVRRVAL